MPDPIRDPEEIRLYSNAMRLLSEQRIGDLTDALLEGGIDLATWQIRMKEELRQANKEQFVVGKGGDISLMDTREWLALGPELKKQYKFLEKFARYIKEADDAGKPLTFVKARALLYSRSSQAMFWKSYVPVKIPQVPRDGQTVCKTNCNCKLQIEHERDGNTLKAVLVSWKLSKSEHCRDCLRLAREWNPLRIDVNDESEASTMSQSLDLLLQNQAELRQHRAELAAFFGIEE